MSPNLSNTMPVVHGQQLFQQVRNLVSRSLADAEKNSDTYSKAYQKELQRLVDQCDAAGAKSPKERMEDVQGGEGDALFNDPAHRALLRTTAVGRSIDDARRGRG
jgi:hypothetical protein